MDTLYTTQEVAAQFKVPKVTVQKWIRDGKLAASLIGKGYRIRESDLKAFEEAGRKNVAT